MTTREQGKANDPQAVEAHLAGPSFRTYVAIGVWLTVITVAEVALYYVDFWTPALVALLLLLGALKFVLVVAFFMHLKYDTRLFSGAFGFGMMVATSLLVALVVLFRFAHFTMG